MIENKFRIHEVIAAIDTVDAACESRGLPSFTHINLRDGRSSIGIVLKRWFHATMFEHKFLIEVSYLWPDDGAQVSIVADDGAHRTVWTGVLDDVPEDHEVVELMANAMHTDVGGE